MKGTGRRRSRGSWLGKDECSDPMLSGDMASELTLGSRLLVAWLGIGESKVPNEYELDSHKGEETGVESGPLVE